ncbi:MAG: hypothetical protein KY475_10320 [Planctomycetes bacterium]|nr:hypothetical protein [Planctomycetota bacterium]
MRLLPTIPELILLLLIVIVLGSLAYDWYAGYCGERDGAAEAVEDLAAGRLRLKLGGKIQPWNSNLVGIFRERYGIDVQFVHGCVPSAYDSAYTRAYNERVLRHIADEAPEFSLDRAFDEAHDEWIAQMSRFR